MVTSKEGVERLIRKYPSRRLYDTQTSTYITLVDVKQLVVETEEFRVISARSGGGLTRNILLQTILKEEAGDVPMFSGAMLARVIRLYDSAMQGIVGTYLKKNIQAPVDIQSKLAENSKNLYSDNTFNLNMWLQFMNIRGPVMQGTISSYIEQSRNPFMQIQEQMQSQAENMFGTFPFNQLPEKK